MVTACLLTSFRSVLKVRTFEVQEQRPEVQLTTTRLLMQKHGFSSGETLTLPCAERSQSFEWLVKSRKLRAERKDRGKTNDFQPEVFDDKDESQRERVSIYSL